MIRFELDRNTLNHKTVQIICIKNCHLKLQLFTKRYY